VREEASTDDGVVRIVELEQQRLPGIQRPEHPVAAGLPEVDLVEVRPSGQELVPVLVRDRDEGAHAGILAEPPMRLPGPVSDA
jgi:hypothetical protein